MKIDYEKNPLAIVRRFSIRYAEGSLWLEGRIMGRTEEGVDNVNWFQGEVVYNNHNRHPEIGGMQFDNFYKTLKRGAKNLGAVERKMKAWCRSMGLEISAEWNERVGVMV